MQTLSDRLVIQPYGPAHFGLLIDTVLVNQRFTSAAEAEAYGLAQLAAESTAPAELPTSCPAPHLVRTRPPATQPLPSAPAADGVIVSYEPDWVIYERGNYYLSCHRQQNRFQEPDGGRLTAQDVADIRAVFNHPGVVARSAPTPALPVLLEPWINDEETPGWPVGAQLGMDYTIRQAGWHPVIVHLSNDPAYQQVDVYLLGRATPIPLDTFLDCSAKVQTILADPGYQVARAAKEAQWAAAPQQKAAQTATSLFGAALAQLHGLLPSLGETRKRQAQMLTILAKVIDGRLSLAELDAALVAVAPSHAPAVPAPQPIRHPAPAGFVSHIQIGSVAGCPVYGHQTWCEIGACLSRYWVEAELHGLKIASDGEGLFLDDHAKGEGIPLPMVATLAELWQSGALQALHTLAQRWIDGDAPAQQKAA